MLQARPRPNVVHVTTTPFRTAYTCPMHTCMLAATLEFTAQRTFAPHCMQIPIREPGRNCSLERKSIMPVGFMTACNNAPAHSTPPHHCGIAHCDLGLPILKL